IDMPLSELPASPVRLGDFIEAYEAAQQRHGQADLADFLPPADHPLFGEVLRELVRVDLEYGHRHGRPTPLAEYQRRYPQLFTNRDALQDIVFEEFRQRQQAGENPSPAEYHQRYGLDTGSWPDVADPRQDERTCVTGAGAVPSPQAGGSTAQACPAGM